MLNQKSFEGILRELESRLIYCRKLVNMIFEGTSKSYLVLTYRYIELMEILIKGHFETTTYQPGLMGNVPNCLRGHFIVKYIAGINVHSSRVNYLQVAERT